MASRLMRRSSSSPIIREMQIELQRAATSRRQSGHHWEVYKLQMLERAWKKGSPPSLLVRMSVSTATVENNKEVPQKTKNRITIRSSNPTPGHTSRQNSNSKGYTHLDAHRSTIYNSQTWKQPKCPTTDEGIKKRCIHIQWNTAQP